MVTITPEMTGNVLIASLASYVVVVGYSIYMAVLNRKQAKVVDAVKETNRILYMVAARCDEISHNVAELTIAKVVKKRK